MKRIFLFIAIVALGLSACSKDEPKVVEYAEITVGEHNEGEVALDKNNTLSLKLSGGNGKFTATAENPKVLEAKIDGEYLILRGINYGETVVSLRSHDRRRTLKVRVERPALHLTDNVITLKPGEVRKDITVRGGGDDADYEVLNPEHAIDARWVAGSGVLELSARHEGEATIVFKTKDGKPNVEMKVIVKAENNVSDQVGFYTTRSTTLQPYFNMPLYAYRPGKMVWLSSSTDLSNLAKQRVWLPTIKNPVKGERVTLKVSFLNVDEFTSGEYPLIIEEVQTADELVTLRGAGFKIVAPYDK